MEQCGLTWMTKNSITRVEYIRQRKQNIHFPKGEAGITEEVNHDQDYEWTPAMVNANTFGVRIDELSCQLVRVLFRSVTTWLQLP